MTAQTPSSLSSAAWEQRYQEGTPRWDLGQPAPAFQSLLTAADAPQPGRAIALGAGRGHDAIFFAQQGFEVTAVDFAPSPIQSLREQSQAQQLSLNLLQKDIFDLTPDLAGQFDYAIEHTCFCAIDPSLRPDYVALVADLLVPKGELLAVFFTHQRSGGPPFGTAPAEVRQLFEPYFDIVTLEPVANSVPSRHGEEHFGRLRRR
ncbi:MULTISPECIES: methyltransferase domain-containing protein [Cyanophyceae]|uniref:methyltransferase domain-containing protein n=1 Tax=Cyanophyceae TaxID=3028117 RepID=UPI00168913B5|nr:MULTISPECIES: methyltransferase domain-containing protein [unclassified Phormidium]MBD1918557.1 methyltransferase domain-containing protein [Phormidium sp. FACHB-77]MBD2031446.1 methyltransferase domain-containing protein [Phormidium sp. FACHB-322]MBD2049565.1 methyltransferase domain-containing protein [Leptolyngbya sp. FACHB-60]